ncbi:MAG: methionyl-tRNA formyltransferase [Firmicutes bacterium]|nr:methionyl-tRNA formyltransferase [Bacillota bacterium]
MKIIYIGTPEYACIPLEALVSAGHDVKLVITQPDRPKGRGNKMQKSPVKIEAEGYGIPVLSPEKIRQSEETLAAVRKADADFAVVFSYGQIIPIEILDAPKFGSINIHGSLLPKYRGAAPIQRAVLDGEEETGVTLMHMDAGLDTGDMYVKAKTFVDHKTSAMLFDELSKLGAKLLLESLPKIADGSLKAVPQEGESSYAKMLTKEEGKIDWQRTAEEVDRLVRAFNDSPVAWTYKEGETLKIYETEVLEGDRAFLPGQVISADKKGIKVACKEGAVNILKLQAPGKKMMEASAYLLGNRIETGSFLGV